MTYALLILAIVALVVAGRTVRRRFQLADRPPVRSLSDSHVLSVNAHCNGDMFLWFDPKRPGTLTLYHRRLRSSIEGPNDE